MSRYEPRAGSKAARVLEHLREHRDRWHTPREIAEALQMESSMISAIIATAKARGVVISEPIQGSTAHVYRIADGDPPEAGAPDDGDDAADVPRRSIVSASSTKAVKTGPASVFESAAYLPEPPPGRLTREEPAPLPVAKAEPGFKGWLQRKGEQSAEGRCWQAPAAKKPMRVRSAPVVLEGPPKRLPAPVACALSNTGDLLIEAPDQPALRLTRDQARELWNYLRNVDRALQEAIAP